MKRPIGLCGLALVVTASLTAGSRADFVYNFVTIDIPGATSTRAASLNNGLGIAGQYTDAKGIHGYTLVLGQKPMTFDYVDGKGVVAKETFATGFNGLQTSGYFEDANNVLHGFIRDNMGKFTQIDYPNSKDTQVRGISGAGDVVGSFTDQQGVLHGFIRTFGGTFGLVDPFGNSSSAFGVNAILHIAGTFSDINDKEHGFLRDAKGFTTLDFPGATTTSAFGLNLSDQVGGRFIDAKDKIHGFLYSFGNYQTIDVPNARATVVRGVRGFSAAPPSLMAPPDLVGTYVDAQGNIHGYYAFVAPEPSSWALLATGLLGLATLARARRPASRRPPDL
jgi:hypothetical protein